MPCASCGSENSPGAKYCQSCGQPLVAGQGRLPQHSQPRPDLIRVEAEKAARFSNGMTWLLVSIGTFVVAFGFLNLIDFHRNSEDSMRIIGYGIVIYAIAAAFAALNRFTKRN